jgi:pyruvate/2-oxoglutarate dehydrogenase complex dihydrolipoamide acyltransferase (E2) component
MRRRNESSVYFEQKVDTAKTGEFLRSFRERTGLHATLLHLLIWASGQILKERPRLNRFVAGGRIYQRRGIWISFSAKKEKTDDAPIVAVKRKIDPSWIFEDLVRELESSIGKSRRGKPSATGKELDLLFRLPTFLISRTVWLLMKLDHFGLLPETFIRSDPLFASMFIANLGSIRMDAGFHHLYEYGSIPIFMMTGQSKEEPVIGADGKVAVLPLMTLRYSFDERIEDGLYCLRALELIKEIIEDPAKRISPHLSA